MVVPACAHLPVANNAIGATIVIAAMSPGTLMLDI